MPIIVDPKAKMRYQLWTMAYAFKGYPKARDFSLETRDVIELQENEYLVEALAWSVDPYSRTYADTASSDQFGEGHCIPGFQLCRVIDAKEPVLKSGCDDLENQFSIGELIVGQFGWRNIGRGKVKNFEYFSNPDPIANFWPYRVSEVPVKFGSGDGEFPLTYCLGVFGMTGLTAFYSILDVCRVRPKETIVINAAAGAVGSIACQIAKIKGAHVIALTGKSEKVAWLKSVGIVDAFNYNDRYFKLEETMKKHAPDGVHCFLDLVGGYQAVCIYPFLHVKARVCQTGNISAYNALERPRVSECFDHIVRKELTIVGFNVSRYAGRMRGAVLTMARWINQGKIQVREHVYRGMEQLASALIDLMDGKNIGKTIVVQPQCKELGYTAEEDADRENVEI